MQILPTIRLAIFNPPKLLDYAEYGYDDIGSSAPLSITEVIFTLERLVTNFVFYRCECKSYQSLAFSAKRQGIPEDVIEEMQGHILEHHRE